MLLDAVRSRSRRIHFIGFLVLYSVNALKFILRLNGFFYAVLKKKFELCPILNSSDPRNWVQIFNRSSAVGDTTLFFFYDIHLENHKITKQTSLQMRLYSRI